MLLVPDAIYTIPPSSPAHNGTYVTVNKTKPDTIISTQTAGYSGEYVAANGVLMFGAGLIVGAMITGYHDHDCYPPAAWDTRHGQRAVAKTKNDNVYAARNGNVYKKDADGNWSTNAGGGWKPAVEQPRSKPAAQPQRPASRPQSYDRQSLDSMTRTRARGNTQTQRAQSFQSSSRAAGGRSGGGRSRR